MSRPAFSAFRRHLLLVLVLWGPTHGLRAQETESSGSDPIGGALLGASSGTILGLLGGSAVCSRTLFGSTCPRVSAALGGAVGGVSGAVLGDRDAGVLDDRWRGAGYGALAGGVVGFGLSRVARQYGWKDVGAFVAVGGAIGAAPAGVGIGFGIGAAVGAIGVLAIPKMKIGDAVALSLAGMAVGGLADWVMGAGNAEEGVPRLVVPLQIRF